MQVRALNWSSGVREALECYINQGFAYGLLQSLLTVVHKSRTFSFLVLVLLSCTSSIRIFCARVGSYYPLGFQTIYKFKGCQYSKVAQSRTKLPAITPRRQFGSEHLLKTFPAHLIKSYRQTHSSSHWSPASIRLPYSLYAFLYQLSCIDNTNVLGWLSRFWSHVCWYGPL